MNPTHTPAITPSALGKVAVLFGGDSAEREVSLKSGAAVLAALQQAGVDAHAFDPAHRALGDLKTEGFDRAFIAMHGRGGEDGSLQGALELLGVPYTGSGVLASALGMDKWRTKLIWQAAGIPTPKAMLLTETSNWENVVAELGLPIFVKPAREGSSIGASKVNHLDDLPAAFAAARACDPMVLAESFITGAEYTAAILLDQALPMVKVVAPGGNYNFENKYLNNETQYFCPCGLPPALESRIQALALQAFSILGGRGWARLDVFVTEAGEPSFLEINTSPGMTDHSLVPKSAKQAGIDFTALVLAILAHAQLDSSQK